MEMKFMRLSEFQKDLKRLEKKYSSLSDDLLQRQKALAEKPIRHDTKQINGLGLTIRIMVLKMRMPSKSIRGGRNSSPLRLIYAYDEPNAAITFIELYHKNEKAMENRERIYKYFTKR